MQKKLHSVPEPPIPEHPVPEPLLQKESAPLSSQRSLVCVSCIMSAVYVGRMAVVPVSRSGNAS